jgi:hypothetical protein
LPQYASAGVRAQAFVHILFPPACASPGLTQQFQCIVGDDRRF